MWGPKLSHHITSEENHVNTLEGIRFGPIFLKHNQNEGLETSGTR